MGTKGVFLLGLIVCWTAVGNGEYGFMFDSKLNQEFKRELADENLELFYRAVGADCSETAPCDTRQKCDEDTKKCVCVEGLGGEDCKKVEACETGKFKHCKSPNGTCDYSDEKKEAVCSCAASQKVHPLENKCRVTCNEENACENGGTCDGTGDAKFCSCKSGLYGDKCEKIADCIDGKYKGCEESEGTCTYKDNKAICTCTDNKKLHDTENICKECKCERVHEICSFVKGEKQCNCETGFAKKNGVCTECQCGGDHEICSFVGENQQCNCEPDFSKKNGVCTECKCDGDHEICSFDGENQQCNCEPGFTKKNGVCTAICSKDSECGENEKCKGDADSKTCECADGLSGEKCDKKDWCVDNGKFKNCKGVNGTCDYVKEKRAVDCICTPGKILDNSLTENRCKDTCSTSAKCQNGGTCMDNFCFCFPGYIGDRCEIVFDCTDKGKLQGCSKTGGECVLEGSRAVCNCPVDQKYHDKEHTCKECTCGPHGTCKFVNGEKKCDCFQGFGDKEGTCIATCSTPADCNNNQTCSTVNNWKTCVCASGLSGSFCENLSWCDTRFKNCKGANGTCEYVKEKRSVDCTCAPAKALHPNENRCREKCEKSSDCQNAGSCEKNFCLCKPGVLGDKCETVLDCTDTGKYKGCKASGGNCTHDGNNVVCKCAVNKTYHDTEHICKECNCGTNGVCRFENSQKKCDCNTGFSEKDGICTATCSTSDNCKDNEKCEEKGGWKSCVCADGLSGNDCTKNDWCDGKFKNCKDSNGTCEYNKDKRAVVCTCTSGKTLDKNENRCRETCSSEADCNNKGKCENNFCSCKEGFIGDKCETIFDCTAEGKYKFCQMSGGTCSHDDSKSVCSCPQGKTLHETENICKGKCTTDDECKNGGWCSNELCSCESGLTGDNCETVIECKANGKYRGCESSGGTCSYESGNAVCKCPNNQIYHETEHVCKATCTKNEDCKDNQKCGTKDGWKTCVCADGLSGDNCDKNDWCAGKFKNCKDSNGTCAYNKDKRAVVCTCTSGKTLHPSENRCRDTCNTNEDCKNTGTCANNFCTCKVGVFGDKCETVVDCEPTGKYKGCKNSGGTCIYEGNNAVCNCPADKKLHDTEHICKECSCGPQGTCKFQNGQKNCVCAPGFAEKNGLCTATCTQDTDCKDNQKCGTKDNWKTCVCADGLSGDNCDKNDWCAGKFKNCKGANGTCAYNKDKRTVECTCTTGKALHTTENRCRETCSGDDCKNGGKCEASKFCSCNLGIVGDKCETIFDCSAGKYKNCVSSGGTCNIEDNKAVCKCPGHKTFQEKEGICKEFCTKDEECNGGQCQGVEGKKICLCKNGLRGDRCQTIIDCVDGKYSKCVSSGGECTFDGTQAKCTCSGSKLLDTTLNVCREKCKNDCINGGTCVAELCKCLSGTSGDKCFTIAECENLKCSEKDAECKFNTNKLQAYCECKDKNYYFEENQCKPKFCISGCSTESDCEFNKGVGVCKCKKEGTYYDYTTGKCLSIDKCFNKTCGAGEVCNDGNCVCDENHQLNQKKCEAKDFCDKNMGKCFDGAQCEKSNPLGFVKCICKDPQFYNPRTKKCEDISCFSPKEKKNCKATCPGEMDRVDGVCKHRTDKTKCDKPCGTLGWCYKSSETSQNCVCEPNVAEFDSTAGKCVLKATAVCPTTERNGEDKCKCSGKYKFSANGITCELKSCSDQDVKEDCRKKGADRCVDNWRGDGYKCMCPFGYIESAEKGCIDPCSMDSMKTDCLNKGQVCYIGSKNEQGDCRCLPTFAPNSAKTACEPSGKNTVMIHSLPVLSKKYESLDKSINKVLLNIDVTNSMTKAFKNLDFVHVYNYKVQDGVLLCDIWLQLKTVDLPENFNATLEVQRWKSLAVKANNGHLLPPALFLGNKFKEATEEELTFCSDSVRQSICGKGTSCVKNVCSCNDGFKEIDSTIQYYGSKGRVVRCEDIDECKEGTHKCPANSKCVNTAGDYFCRCNAGYRKKEGAADELDKKECIGLCEAKPCGKGECKLTKENNVDCTCPAGYSGSFCDRKDERLAKASQSTKVVGAVLGTLLGIVIILIIVYIVRQRKNAYSEDFTPAPRVDNAEMIERRPMRGVTNRAYQ